MAGEWIKMRVDLASDPAVVRIRRATGLDGDAVVGKLHRLWAWADTHTADGCAHGLDADWVDELAGAPGFAAAMQAAGWLEIGTDGVTFVNFDRHNGQPAKVRALRKTRMERFRGARSATDAPPEEEKRRVREEKDIPAAPVPTSRPKTAASPGPKVAWSSESGWTGISEADRREWSEAFPGAAIDLELAKATAWLKANPTKAGKRNWRRFVVGWLQRCQDRGGTPSREPSMRPGDKPFVVRVARPDIGGQILSDEEYAREKRRLAQQAKLRAEKEQARRERAGDEAASLGEALGRRIGSLTEGST